MFVSEGCFMVNEKVNLSFKILSFQTCKLFSTKDELVYP